MATGPAEAFTAAQYAALYDTNVLGAHRVNRALLPAMRERGDGLVVWVGSSSTRGGTPRRDSATVRFGMHETSSSPAGGTTKPSKSEPSAATSSPPTESTCIR